MIIDCTSGISQPAQFYVALSRGKTLEKVRIINYNPRFIKCSVKAVEKINQMRSHCTNKIIAPFPSCNQIPEDILSEYKIEKKHHLTIPIDRSELHDDEREIIEKPKRIVNKKQQQTNKKQNVALRFMNPKPESCYANSAMQNLLYAKYFTDLVDSIQIELLLPEQITLVTELKKIINEFKKNQPICISIDSFRTSVSPEYAPTSLSTNVPGIYHDSIDFIDSIFNKMPEFENLFKFEIEIESECTQCGRKDALRKEQMHKFEMLNVIQNESITFKDAMNRELTESLVKRCVNCNPRDLETEDGTIHNILKKVVFKDDQKYMLIGKNTIVNSKINYFKFNDEKYLFNNRSCKWKLIGIIIYISYGEDSGHYYSFTKRSDNQWLKQDCLGSSTAYSTATEKSIAYLEGITPNCPNLLKTRMLLFERI